MKAPTHKRFSELQLALEPARGELVRAFVREASLAEGVPASVASLIADDTAQAWLMTHPEHADFELRFDVILIAPRHLPRHLLAAFDASA